MHFDAGRIKDLQMLEGQLKSNPGREQRGKIESAIGAIKRQAENESLSRSRDTLLEARRKATNARGEANIKNAREAANQLEEQIHKQYGS
jgi:hypothetical protein